MSLGAAIPLIDVEPHCEPALAALRAEPERLALLLASARRSYTGPGVVLADRLTRLWAGRVAGPYAGAVSAVDAAAGRRGAFLLNHSYEWGCTSAAMDDPALGGSTLLRTLDWPFNGLGRGLVVTRWSGRAGPYLSATWPGFVGVLTGLAPRRFAAAINQPPLPLPGWGKAIGWLAARAKVWRSRALPPSHLLRLAFDTCADFEQAVTLIRRTPICIPAAFTLAGSRDGESLVIERGETASFTPVDAVAANHWTGMAGGRGRPRNNTSLSRHVAMCALSRAAPDWSLGWLKPPILQADTRLAVMANPASGRLVVQGLESTGPTTPVLAIGALP